MEQDLDEAALLAINARKARDAAVKAVEEKKKEAEKEAEENNNTNQTGGDQSHQVAL